MIKKEVVRKDMFVVTHVSLFISLVADLIRQKSLKNLYCIP